MKSTCKEDSAPAQPSYHGNEDDDVDVKDDSPDRYHICRPKILYEEEGGHANNEMKRVETDQIVSECHNNVTDGTGNAEDVDVRHVDRPRHISHHLLTRCWWLCINLCLL